MSISPFFAAAERRSYFSIRPIVASAAAQLTGLPPNVEAWLPGVKTSEIGRAHV